MDKSHGFDEAPTGHVQGNYPGWAAIVGVASFFIGLAWHPARTAGHLLFPHPTPTISYINHVLSNPILVFVLGSLLLLNIFRHKIRGWDLVGAAFVAGGRLGTTLYWVILRLAEIG